MCPRVASADLCSLCRVPAVSGCAFPVWVTPRREDWDPMPLIFPALLLLSLAQCEPRACSMKDPQQGLGDSLPCVDPALEGGVHKLR